jgi:hypothetical protein
MSDKITLMVESWAQRTHDGVRDIGCIPVAKPGRFPAEVFFCSQLLNYRYFMFLKYQQLAINAIINDSGLEHWMGNQFMMV